MIVKCSWCGKDMGTKEGGDGVSHGCCPDCVAKETEKFKQTKILPIPIVLPDPQDPPEPPPHTPPTT